jgi:hypothetical protein
MVIAISKSIKQALSFEKFEHVRRGSDSYKSVNLRERAALSIYDNESLVFTFDKMYQTQWAPQDGNRNKIDSIFVRDGTTIV